ncbi:hypothetical protein EDD73_14314 [Heliophilum fasciatum]|uniref:Uncharacterized protein n=1 Tax=Heliophilum fasciatum TaxID=35700 RepID=A0A4R2R9T6_9FIRM|nr:hypothetical protein [Heliophilum fasciatum]TCP60000.1 hypothetical protein EDD73_14314 [Heliophilum fasciatum]
MKEIKLTWVVKKVEDTSRVNAMYCFKSCSANQN